MGASHPRVVRRGGADHQTLLPPNTLAVLHIMGKGTTENVIRCPFCLLPLASSPPLFLGDSAVLMQLSLEELLSAVAHPPTEEAGS